MTAQTFLDISGMIAKSLDLPRDQVPAILRRIRLFDAKGLLKTIREDSGRREGRLDRIGAAEAVLFSELLDMGFNVDMLRELRAALDRKDDFCTIVDLMSPVYGDGRPGLEVKLYRADLVRTYTFRDLDEPARQDRVSRTLALRDEAERVATVLTVDLERLLSGFLAEFDAVAGPES